MDNDSSIIFLKSNKFFMKNLLFLSVFYIISIFSVFSQEECGTDEIINRNPFLQQVYEERVACAPEVNLDTAQVLTIPVVVHIVHLGEPVGEQTNISDEQVLSMVENLNHRFRADTDALSQLVSSSGTQSYDEYQLSLAIDSKIEFCMAQRDPDNQPTDGIVRHDGSNLVYNGESYAEDGVAIDSQSSGISDSWMKSTLGCWDTEKYYNIWIVTEIGGNNGGGGIQGYSYIGYYGTSCNSGPVLLYNVAGTVGNIKLGNLNSTTAHEVGHSLGLYHTFWNTTNCTGESTCTNGDYIPDTPVTSSNISCSFPDCEDAITENYMDYTSQSCRIMFTQNQIEEMRNVLWSDMNGVINNNYNCQSLSSKDLAITGVYGLPESWCQSLISFNVKVNNLGGDDAVDGVLSINGTLYDLPTIPSGDFTVMEFVDYTLGNGQFNFEVILDGDEYPSNNTAFESVIVENESLLELAVTTEFFANQNTYTLTDEVGNVLLDEGGFGAGITTRVYELCLPDGCYTLTLYDSDGNGWQYGGEYTITINGEEISSYTSSGSWSEYSENFCVDYTCELETDICPWDLNDDNVVNNKDLLVLLTNMDTEVGYCTPGDFNFDGFINQDDINLLVDNYGMLCAEGVIENKKYISLSDHYVVGGPSYYDMSGKQVIVLSPADLSPGVYLVTEKWSDGTVITKKIYINSW
jgi:hypothetical protein